jgi:hypothetical protein
MQKSIAMLNVIMQSIITLNVNVIMLNIVILNVIMQSIITLNVNAIMLNIVILNAIMLSIVRLSVSEPEKSVMALAPDNFFQSGSKTHCFPDFSGIKPPGTFRTVPPALMFKYSICKAQCYKTFLSVN